MGKTIAYVRVSTAGQDIENQEHAILKYADTENLE